MSITTKLNENNYKKIPITINKLLDIPSLYRHGLINSNLNLSFFHSILYLLDEDYRKVSKKDKELIVESLIKNLNTYISSKSSLKNINVSLVNINSYEYKEELIRLINEYISKIFKKTYNILLIKKVNDIYVLSEVIKPNINYLLIVYNQEFYEPLFQKKSSENKYSFTIKEIKQSGGENASNNDDESYEPNASQPELEVMEEVKNNNNEEEATNSNNSNNNTNNNTELSDNRIVPAPDKPAIQIQEPSSSEPANNSNELLVNNLDPNQITTNDEEYDNNNVIELEDENVKKLKKEEIDSLMEQQSLYYDDELVYNKMFNLLYNNYDNEKLQNEKATKLRDIYMDTIKYRKAKINMKSFLPVIHMDVKEFQDKVKAFEDFKPDNDYLYNYQEHYKIFVSAMMPYKYLSTNYQILVKFDERTPAYILNMENEKSSDDEFNVVNKATIIRSLNQIQLINKIENHLENREMVNYYNSQYVNLIGFYSKNDETTDKYETFNINNYLNQLQELNENDKVEIYFNDFYYNRGNELIEKTNGKVIKKGDNKVIIDLDNSILYKYDKEPITKLEYDLNNLKINNYIVYKETASPQYVYRKKDLLNKNILFLFDNKFNTYNNKIKYINSTINFISPKINELLYIYNDIIKNKYTFDLIEYLLEKYNSNFTNIFVNNADYDIYKKFIENIINEVSERKDIPILNTTTKEIKEEDRNIYNNYKLLLEVVKGILENNSKKNYENEVSKYELALSSLEKKGIDKLELDPEQLRERGELIEYNNDIELIMENCAYNDKPYNEKLKYALVKNITNIKNDKYIEYFKQLKEELKEKINSEEDKENKEDKEILKNYNQTLDYYLKNEYLVDLDFYNLSKNNEYFSNRESKNETSSPSIFIRHNNKWIYIGYLTQEGKIDILQLYKLIYASYNNLWNLPLSEIDKVKNILNYYMESENMSYLRDFYKSMLNIDEILKIINQNIKNIDINIELWDKRLELINKRIKYENLEFSINIENVYKNIEGDIGDEDDELFWTDLDNIDSYGGGEIQVQMDTINEKYISKNEIYEKLDRIVKEIDIKLENNEFLFMKEYIENLLGKIFRTSILKYIRDKVSEEDKKNINIKKLKELIETDYLFYINKDIKLKISDNIEIFSKSEIFKSIQNLNRNVSSNILSFGIAFITIYLLIHYKNVSSLIDNIKIKNTLLYGGDLNKTRDIIITILIGLLNNIISSELGKKFNKDDLRQEVIRRYNRILEMVVLFKRKIDKIQDEMLASTNNQNKNILNINNKWDLFRPIPRVVNKDSKLSKYLNELYQLLSSKVINKDNIIIGKTTSSFISELNISYDYYNDIKLEYDKTNSKYIDYNSKMNKDIRLLLKNDIKLSYKVENKTSILEFKNYDNKNIKLLEKEDKEVNFKNTSIDNILNLVIFKKNKLKHLEEILLKIKDGKLNNANILNELNKLQKVIENKFLNIIENIKGYDEIQKLMRLFIEFKDFNNNKLKDETIYLNFKNSIEKILNYDMKYIVSRIINNYDGKVRIKYEKKQKQYINKWTEKDIERIYNTYQIKVKLNDEYILKNKYDSELLENETKKIINKELLLIFKDISISSILELKVDYNIIILLALLILLLEEILDIIENKSQIKDINKREKVKQSIISGLFFDIYEKLNKLIIPDSIKYINMDDKIEKLMREIKEKQKKKRQDERIKEQELMKALTTKEQINNTKPTEEDIGHLDTSIDEHKGDFGSQQQKEEYAYIEDNGMDMGDIREGEEDFIDEDDA